MKVPTYKKNRSKTHLPTYLYGAAIVLVGLFFFFTENMNYQEIRYPLGIGLSVCSILAFSAAFSRKRKQVQFAYHEMHALAMLVFGITLILFSTTFESMILLTTFLLFFYALTEIIFCSWLFNLGQKISLNVILLRLFLALAVGIGTVVSMSFPAQTIPIFGILFIIIGTNVLLYVPAVRTAQAPTVSYDFYHE